MLYSFLLALLCHLSIAFNDFFNIFFGTYSVVQHIPHSILHSHSDHWLDGFQLISDHDFDVPTSLEKETDLILSTLLLYK